MPFIDEIHHNTWINLKNKMFEMKISSQLNFVNKGKKFSIQCIIRT